MKQKQNFILLLFISVALVGCNNLSKNEKLAQAIYQPNEAELVTGFGSSEIGALYDSIHYLANYIDPLIGTGGHGHTFPGATMPFGMVQLSPDTRKDSWDGCSGYHESDATIIGFSHTHLSGTGVGDYGDVRLMPTIGKVQLIPCDEKATETGYRSKFSHENEFVRAGYYRVHLNDYNIKAELTAGERYGFHRYTFPESKEAHIILDLFEAVTTEYIYESSIKVESNTVVSGSRRSKGWANDQHLYFYAEFSKPFKSYGISVDDKMTKTAEVSSKNLKAHFDFDTENGEQILVKVGISAVDAEGARKNLEAEMDAWDFDTQRIKTFAAWNDEMKRVVVEGTSEADKTIFYSAMYHTMIAPNLYSDADGRYRGHDLKVHQTADDRRYTVFSLWDTFRALHPLFTITQRECTAEMIRTFLDIADKGTGLLPVWELAANETDCMIGYHAIPVIVDAWFNGIRDFDAEKALEAMLKNARHDRLGLQYYKNEGLIPSDGEGESVSKTLEYAYDDWCIARFAEDLGKQDIAAEFYQRAQYYKNLYDSETKFFRGRLNGGFIHPFDPTQVNFMLTEANSWQYNFFVPQDVNGHIEIMGGNKVYETMLDELFESKTALTGRQQSDITGLIGQYAHGNEPSHHMVYLYNFIGKPTKTQKLVRQIMNELYTTEKDGLIGNEDCGQMSAWYVMSALGFYPVTPGSSQYIIGAPRFDNATIQLENGKTFVVKAKELNEENIYVKKIKLNGKELKNSYLSHQDIINGGELLFEMTSDPNTEWGTKETYFPVAHITKEFITAVPSINASSQTFTDTLIVKMCHFDPKATIHFTLDGTIPTAESAVYTSPITIDQTTQVNAVAVADGKESKLVQAKFWKNHQNWTIKLDSKYDLQYHAGGDYALIDKLRGGSDFRTGSWQGYQGQDLIVTIDFGKTEQIKRIAGSFLQDVRSWILMPKALEFYVSTDGKSFEKIGTVKNTVLPSLHGNITQEMELKTNVKARSVKIVAESFGLLPEDHISAGNLSWIFADEIILDF
ncbi:MAG: GH92 family glycosyl hydrolase [Lentimicrobiaceae bacterium]|jgi:predicted alpha-1,2-mannosidase|nr:GH92 family glycosyl hydrolase [Lentimicrobiaceae bacterium]